MTQASHASVAAIFKNYEDQNVTEYLSQLDTMHKVVLEIGSETKLNNLAKKLEENQIKHYLWTEQPENIPTALATMPYEKDFIKPYFKKLNMFK